MTAPGRAGGRSSTHRSIGAVLDLLRPDFPDVTISKIRFLEAEGLISPSRTPAGYRQFSPVDLERLRFVLTAQRDHYLPLRVIRDQLDAADRGTTPTLRAPRSLVVAGAAAPTVGRAVRLTREELLEHAGAEEDLLAELVAHGLVRPGAAGLFDGEDVVVLTAARRLAEHGLQPRHLRAFRTSADREAEVLAQIAGPVARRGDAEARGRAEELTRELAALSVTLHTTLVRTALRRELDGS